VETAFSGYYRKINEEDESTFTAKLLPSIGKLGFDVDFYVRGHFPPGAYHSEGHGKRQDTDTPSSRMRGRRSSEQTDLLPPL
jgi:hypothetical protein